MHPNTKNLLPSLLLILLIIFLLSSSAESIAQPKAATITNNLNPVELLNSSIENYNKRLPFEKLFVHTDKSFYTVGDTLWFKSYLFNGTHGSYSTKSGIVYLDLITDSGMVTKSISVPAVIGLSWGQIILPEESIREGFYTLRAYTNWMQNFGEDTFFSKRIYIASMVENRWLVNQKNNVTTNASKKDLSYSLDFKRADKDAFGFKTLLWQLRDERKTQAKGTYETLNNPLNANIDLSGVKWPLIMRVQEKTGQKQQLNFPLVISPSPDIDLQFMPEGGYLVAGLPTELRLKHWIFTEKALQLAAF